MSQIAFTQALRISAVHPCCIQLDGQWGTDGADMRDFTASLMGQVSDEPCDLALDMNDAMIRLFAC
eukprot:3637496-Amphidinium_carterae.1